jgi:NAD(P)-dependent dehydrogenase (short-subunit alcohol dehydrogenase family)
VPFTAADVPDQTGKCIVVTGANTGLGFEAAKVLAARHARVVMACRTEAKAEAAMARIRRDVPGAELVFLPLDQGDLDSIREAVESLKQEPRIDVLLNNAGVMFPPLDRTKQGFEQQFGVNHLGCFALTGLLLSKLAETPGARVVVTASLAHFRGRIPWDDLNAEKSYQRGKRYAASKLANLLFVHELDRRLRTAASPVTALACHPGVAPTDLMRHLGPYKIFTPLFGLFNTVEMGAWPALEAATSADVEPGGYYGPQGIRGMKGPSGKAFRTAQSQDFRLSRRLWEVSVAMTGVDPGLPAVG